MRPSLKALAEQTLKAYTYPHAWGDVLQELGSKPSWPQMLVLAGVAMVGGGSGAVGSGHSGTPKPAIRDPRQLVAQRALRHSSAR